MSRLKSLDSAATDRTFALQSRPCATRWTLAKSKFYQRFRKLAHDGPSANRQINRRRLPEMPPALSPVLLASKE